MLITWVMVANASQAKLFSNTGPQRALQFVKELAHPESREKTSNLVSDRSGSRNGTGHGAFTQATDPKYHEAERFAQEVTRELEQGLAKKAYDRLILVAAAPFVGLINSRLPGQVRSRLSESIEKDYTRLPAMELTDQLRSRVIL
jgi:protein required for attachment to host cells